MTEHIHCCDEVDPDTVCPDPSAHQSAAPALDVGRLTDILDEAEGDGIIGPDYTPPRLAAYIVDRLTAAPALDAWRAAYEWYSTTHADHFGHDHHCDLKDGDPDDADKCSCGWSALQIADARLTSQQEDDPYGPLLDGVNDR